MAFSSCVSPEQNIFVLDASVAINLLASGRAQEILSALPGSRVLVPGPVYGELSAGQNGEARGLAILAEAGVIERIDLTGPALEAFGALVQGSSADTLGDGEAATIAIAVELGAVAAIDERKGWRISGERFPALGMATTVDLMAYESVEEVLGRQALGTAVLAALEGARMQVRAEQLEWVISRIGMDQAAGCSSLRRLMRNVAQEYLGAQGVPCR